MKKEHIIIITLILALAVLAGYLLLEKYQEARQKEQISILQQGMQLGYTQAILQLIQQAKTCQQVPVFANNQTINVISVECLKNK